MARKAADKSAPPPSSDTGFPPNSIEVDIVNSSEMWSEYQLADGTRLRVRPVLSAAFRIPNQWMPDGEPVYGTRLTFVADVRAPGSLRRKKS
jgi:hypothetical protein